MTEPRLQTARRAEALSKARIVRAAIGVLDEGGAEALTYRVLADRLSTGAGAIYHHVANKQDLLAAAALEVMTTVLDTAASEEPPQDIRAVMLGAFEVISTRPWVGTQLAAAPWQPAVLRLFERIGSGLDALGVPDSAQFDAASVLVHHVLGVASQYDAGTRSKGRGMGRPAFLESAVAELQHLDSPDQRRFLTRLSQQLTGHDDREQFRAGVDIILAGIDAL